MALVLVGSLGDPEPEDDVTSRSERDVARTEPKAPALTRPEEVAAPLRSDPPPDGERWPEGTPLGSVQVTAIDGLDRTPVLRFWVERDQLVDVAAEVVRFPSDPASGAARVPRLGKGSAEPVTIHSPAYRPAQAALGSGEALEVRLERATCLVGRVVDGASAPLPSARVYLEYLGPLDASLEVAGPSTQPPAIAFPESYGGGTLRRTDNEGRFAFTKLPAGIYRTRVEVDGTEASSAPRYVRSSAWTTSDHWLDQHARLVARVLRPDGTPAPSARLSLTPVDPTGGSPASEPSASRYTDETGEVVIGPLTPGRFRVTIQSDDGGFSPVEIDIRPDGPSIVDRTFELTGRSG